MYDMYNITCIICIILLVNSDQFLHFIQSIPKSNIILYKYLPISKLKLFLIVL